MRVTTTEARDIFLDDEIWNDSMFIYQDVVQTPLSQRRANPEEEYFRLTMLALKIEHSETDDDLAVFNISEGKLFRMIKRK